MNPRGIPTAANPVLHLLLFWGRGTYLGVPPILTWPEGVGLPSLGYPLASCPDLTCPPVTYAVGNKLLLLPGTLIFSVAVPNASLSEFVLRFQRAQTTVKRAQRPASVTVDSVTPCTPSGPPTRSVTVSYHVKAYLL